MKRVMSWVTLVTTLAACASGRWTDFYGDERSAAIPRDVRNFVTKAQACRHFVGEDPYDAQRAAFLKTSIGENCTALEEMRERLLKRHEGHIEVRTVVSETWQKFNE